MGTKANPRRKGAGGLYIRKQRVWNEVKQTFETIEVVQASKEIRDPQDPTKRKRLTGTGRTAEEAQLRLTRSIERYFKKRGLQEAGIPVPARRKGQQTVAAWLEEWHASIPQGSISPQLKIKYLQYMRNHVSPHVGNLALIDLTHHHLNTLFFETLPAKRKVLKGEVTELPLLGPNGLRNIYKTLNQALKMAVKLKRIDRNPLELVKAPTFQAPKENIPQLMHIAEHMFQKMAEANDPAFDHFILALLGLRKGERLGLTFSNLTLTGPNPKISIQNQLARITGQGLVLKPSTKTGKDRTVALQDPWLSSLRKMKAYRKRQQQMPEFNPRPEFEDLVFLRDDGKPWDLNDDNDYWLEINKKYNAKRPPIRGHALRHIAATAMADNEVNPEIAMAILGHESEAIGYYYRRITAKRQSEEVARYGSALSKRFEGKKPGAVK